MAIYADAAGFKIVINVAQDISNATVTRIYYEKPSGVKGYWPASLRGLTEIVHSVSQADFDEVGRWAFQGYVETPSWSLPSEKFYLDIDQSIIP